MVGVAHTLGQIGLDVKTQRFVRAVGQVMQVTAHGPQKALRGGEAFGVGLVQNPVCNQPGQVVHAVQILGNPKQRLQIAQTPFAVFDVGFKHIAGIAHAGMTVVAFVQLGLDEGGPRSFDHVGIEALFKIVKQVDVAANPARLQQRGGNGDVGLGQGHGIGDGACGVADFQA